ncbi:MAG TPA: hypothetical protein ENK63_03800 [Rhodobacterales bacterium]|nr:hypothetical protein [Rhodobacterales bacterium]
MGIRAKKSEKDDGRLLEELENYAERILEGEFDDKSPGEMQDLSREFINMLEDNDVVVPERVKRALPAA